MDFGGFILFILCSLGLIAGAVICLLSFLRRSPARWMGLSLVGAGCLLLALFARLLYQTYWLDENLWIAAYSGDTNQVKSLLAAGANPNARWEDGSTPLTAAERSNQKDIETLLRTAGGHE